VRRIALLAVLTAFLPAPLLSAALRDRSIEHYTLTVADPLPLIEQVRLIVGAEGQIIDDRPNNRLIVFATEPQHERIRALLQPLAVAPRNIQIQVRIVDRGASVAGTVSAAARGTVVIPDTERSRARVEIRATDQRVQSSRESTQFITVLSGGRASILVAEEVPYTDWFYEYGVRYGYLRAETKWRQVGASLIVEPEIVGDGTWIHVRLTPELSYFVDRQRFTTAFVNASTEVTARNGQELNIAGSIGNQDFYSRFLVGFDNARTARTLDIILRPMILQ
jgi:type II secretory pathway component GspD/PulD (secretin)